MIHIRIPLYLILPNTESSFSLIQGCPISYIPYICHFFTSIVDIGNCLSGLHVRGCLHDTVTTFAPTFAQVHSISLSWLYSCLHDTTTKCHAGASHPGVSLPGYCTWARNSLRYKISQRYHVNTKRPPVSVWNRSAGELDRPVANTQCLRFWIARVLYQHEVYLQITETWNNPSSCKRDTK